MNLDEAMAEITRLKCAHSDMTVLWQEAEARVRELTPAVDGATAASLAAMTRVDLIHALATTRAHADDAEREADRMRGVVVAILARIREEVARRDAIIATDDIPDRYAHREASNTLHALLREFATKEPQ